MRLIKMSRVVPAGAVAAMTVCAALASAGSASAVTLNGDWGPFTRCPVDDPSMLAADGSSIIAACASSDSPNGSIKIRNTTTSTGESSLQFGLVENTSAFTFSLVSPVGGALVTAPAQVPGGVLGLMCPSDVPVVSSLCDQAANGSLNAVTATVEPAGPLSNFNFVAEINVGEPILTLPVKIHLHNPLLGSNCYIGSDSNPIVLHPENLPGQTITGQGENFDTNGTPDPNGVLLSDKLFSQQGDNTFSVPGASGCGGILSLLVDPAIDLKMGLPSPSGQNSLVLNTATSDTATYSDPAGVAPNEGQDLSADWHSAVQ